MHFKTTVALGDLSEIAELLGVGFHPDKPLPVPRHIPPYPQRPIRHGFYFHTVPNRGNKKLLTGPEAMIRDYNLAAIPEVKGSIRTQSRYYTFLCQYVLAHVESSNHTNHELFESHVERWNFISMGRDLKIHLPKYVFNPPWGIGNYSSFRERPNGVIVKQVPQVERLFSMLWVGEHGYVIAKGASNNCLEFAIFSTFELDLRITKALHDATDPYILEKIFRLLNCFHIPVENLNIDLMDDDMHDRDIPENPMDKLIAKQQFKIVEVVDIGNGWSYMTLS